MKISVVFNWIAIFALLRGFFFCSYIFATYGVDLSLLLILFLRVYIYFVCRLCVRLLRRVKNLLPWILFKVCLPFRWAKCKVCENFRRMKRFKIGSNSFIFQKMVRCSLWSIRHTSCSFMLVSVYFWRVGNCGELTCQCDIITRSCDLFYWPYILIVSSGCIYLFDYIIASSYVLLKLVCVAHFDVWTLALSRVISMMTTDLLLLLFERNCPKRLSYR